MTTSPASLPAHDPLILTAGVARHEARAGTLLAKATSHCEGHTHDAADRSGRCSACRWTEIEIWRLHEGRPEARDQYAVVVRGCSLVPGEVERGKITVTTSTTWAVECLALRRDNGEAFLSNTARQALAEASAFDAALEDAFINRAIA